MDSETQEIIDHFLSESREAVAEVEPLLIELEAQGGAPDRSTIDAIFRLFHSMKGSAGFLEFRYIERVTHSAESLLERLRRHTLPLSESVVDTLCRALDFTNEALDCVEARRSDAELAGASAALVAHMDGFVASKPIKKTRAGAVESSSERGGIHGFELPPPEAPFTASGEAGRELSAVFEDRPGGAVVWSNGSDAPPVATADAVTGPSMGAVSAEDRALTDLLQRVAEASRAAHRETSAGGGDPAETAASAPGARSVDPVRPASLRRRVDYLRVDVRKLDQLMDLVGELIIAETAVTHGPQHAHHPDGQSKAAVQLNRVTRGLQDVAMSLRMVPISPTFKKMKRLVRDVSKKQGKQVLLELSGEDTEVDKSVVEAISDPLVHLIRNAIDHGIEGSSERQAAGKAGPGRICLSARQQAGEIHIILRDDGQGLSRERILRKAREAGLVRGVGGELSDTEVFRLIFEPGFSTASELTDISGRGVGMDVVRRSIEAVKGRVDVSSEPGMGTTVTLRIPLSLAIIEGMLVRVGDTRFTLPMLSIVETVVVRGDAVTRLTNGVEVARIRGQIIPVFRIHRFYEIEPESPQIEDGLLVVVEDGADRICLLVDELVGQRQTVIKGLSGYLGNVRGLAGCTVLGDGSISLIIDVAKLIRESRVCVAA